MADTLEIIRAISQAQAASYDGAHDERYSLDGETHKTGLRREEGDIILDSRINDGYAIKFHGDRLCIHYHAEPPLKEVHGSQFEANVESTISSLASFLKKEYKAATGNSLSLTADGEVDILVQNTSRVRTIVQAHRYYKIGGLSEVESVPTVERPDERKIDKTFKDWLALGDGPKPKNVTRKGKQ